MLWMAAAVVAPVILVALNFIIDHFNFDSDEFFKQEWANNAKLILMIIVYIVLGMTPVCGIIASIMLVIEIVKENSRVSEFCELCRREANFTCNYNAGLFTEAIGEEKIAEIVGANEDSELFVNAPLVSGPVGSHTFVAFDAGFTDRTSNYSYQKNLYTIIAIGSGDDRSNWILHRQECCMPAGELFDAVRQL